EVREMAGPPHFILTLQRRPGSPLFPCTTLFRSRRVRGGMLQGRRMGAAGGCCRDFRRSHGGVARMARSCRGQPVGFEPSPWPARSEEHMSELQSRENLVCRLLLEKKNTWRSSKP